MKGLLLCGHGQLHSQIFEETEGMATYVIFVLIKTIP